MAKNAAGELLELFGSWKHTVNGSNASVMTQRGDSGNLGEALWRNELAAVRLLLEIEEFIEQEEDRHEYEEFLSEIRSFVFVPERGWGQGPADMKSSTRIVLVQLRKLMAASPTRQLNLTADQIASIQDALDECDGLLDPSTTALDPGLEHLRVVIQHLRKLLDGDDVDFDKVRAASYEAIGLAAIHGRVLPEEKRERVANALWTVVLPFATGTASGAAGNLLSAAMSAALQITP